MSKCRLKSKEWPCLLEKQNCQSKNKNWACIHELKCLYVFKQIEKNDFDKNSLFEELAQNNIFTDIGKKTEKRSIKNSRISSIKQKIYNINFLSRKKIQNLGSRSNKSTTTEKIFEKYKNWDTEKLREKIKILEKNIDQKI